MLTYITENDYTSLMGTSVPENFNKLNTQASTYINHKTRGRITDICDEVKYVTCLLIDLVNDAESKKSEIGNLKSQNIEGWSETYQTPEEIDRDFEAKASELLSQYLWNVIADDGKSVLYKGVLLCE